MKIKKNISKILWQEFLKDTLENNIYSQYKYLEIINHKFNNYILYDGEKPMVGAIIFQDNLKEVPTFYNTLFLSKTINSPHKIIEVSSIFLDQLKDHEKKIHLRTHHNFCDIRSFQWFNYSSEDSLKFFIQPYYTCILDINESDNNQILKKINNGRKGNIKNAIKNNFFSEISNDVEILNKLNNQTFLRQRNKNEIFLSTIMADKAIKNNFASLLVTYDNLKNPHAASLFLHDDDASYYVVGGSLPETRQNGAASLNIYDQILNSINLKKKEIDFVGVNSPNRGYFKTSFGGHTKIYFELFYG